MTPTTPRNDFAAVSMARLQHELATPLGVATMATSVAGDMRAALLAWAQPIGLTPEQLSSFEQQLANLEEAQTLAQVGLSNAALLLRLYGQDSARQTQEVPLPGTRNVNLRQCLERASRMLYLGDESAMGRCHIDVPEGLNLDTDEVAWYQICTNLIKNSHRHAHVDGIAQQIFISVTVNDDASLCLDYCDNGQGLSHEVRRELVDDDDQLRAEWAGLGLGFRIIREVVHARLNGSVKLPASADRLPGFAARIEVPLRTRPSHP